MLIMFRVSIDSNLQSDDIKEQRNADVEYSNRASAMSVKYEKAGLLRLYLFSMTKYKLNKCINLHKKINYMLYFMFQIIALKVNTNYC